jgi:hypothetical protein
LFASKLLLYNEGRSMKKHASLNFSSDMTHGYIEGYRRAAVVLAEGVLEQGMNIDYLVYPLGFLWRHHFELQLKYLLAKAGQLDGTLENDNHGHSLKKLWQRLKPKLEELNPAEKEFLKCIDDAVSLVSGLDDSGQEFRYAQKKEGKQLLTSLPVGPFDVGDLDATCKAAAENLQCINDWIKVEADRYLEFLWHTQDGECLDQP